MRVIGTDRYSIVQVFKQESSGSYVAAHGWMISLDDKEFAMSIRRANFK